MRYFSRIEYQTGLPVLDMWPWFDKLPKVKPLPAYLNNRVRLSVAIMLCDT
ncbi:hypothetical protein RchiOBHm_Chr7g0238101 [Rosa chinensis]|uniref:Uncharacterized protein n=1 Tax=Rosa chinensis TaxID=74649 RepID=A0A2P6PHF5_ROSCH|nr:hypothetical protein RchiOBHm_Chr7g0238101 [Rosa chinensis]